MTRVWPYPLIAAGILFLGTLTNQWVIGARALPGESARLAADQAARILALGFVLQAVLNPLVGALGDRLRARWGTRRGLIVVGAPLQALGFLAVWRDDTPVAVAILVTQACMVFVNQPWTAMLPAVASDQALRVRLSAASGAAGLLGAVVALALGPWLVGSGGPASLGPAGAGIFLLLVLLPALLLREAAPAPAQQAPLQRIAAWTLLRRGPVQRVLAVQALLGLAVLSLTAVVPPAAALLVGRTPAQLNAWLAGGMLLGPLLLALLANRLGPARLLAAAATAGALALTPLALLRPQTFSLWAAGLLLLGAVSLLALAIPPLLLARLSDEESKRSGSARDGLLFGLGGTALCLGQAAGSALTGGLLGAHADAEGLIEVLLAAAAALASVAALEFSAENSAPAF